MENFIEWLKTTEGMAIGIPVLIFLLTLFFAAKRWINLTTTVIFLLIALGLGWAITNQDVIRGYFNP